MYFTSVLKMKKLLTATAFYILGLSLYAQTCTIQVSVTKACVGNTISFSVTTSGGTPTGYNWAFGDGFTSTLPSPLYTYLTAGVFNPSVTVTFAGGLTCTSVGSPLPVYALPQARFTITSSDTLCFKNNQLCIKDQSTSGTSGAPITKRIFQLNNGYVQTDFAPLDSNICYRNNTERNGHLYDIVVEVTDSNNCVNRVQKNDSVYLLPEPLPIQFSVANTLACSVTTSSFTNTSARPLSAIRKFYWIFGNGLIDSTNWASTNIVYAQSGQYRPELITIDTNGCIDTAKSSASLSIANPNDTIYGVSPMVQCYDSNAFSFRSTNSVPVEWTIFDMSGAVVFQTGSTPPVNGMQHRFLTCGKYLVQFKAVYPSCTIIADTIVTVKGPKSIIQTPLQRIVNRTQCEIDDTVYFKTPVPYLSCREGNGAMQHLWDFGDAWAPPCTTDTKNGLNVNTNCNYSLDSMVVKHAYTPGREQCYTAKLKITDPTTGCSHTDTAYLALTSPDASPAPSATPPRRGLYFEGSPCIGQNLKFYLNETLPSCGYERAYMNFDSACDPTKWVLVDTLSVREVFHSYDSICDPNGWVTIGLIIQNGRDASGNICYDTAWYHHFFRILPVQGVFEPVVLPGCKPFQVDAVPTDSIMKNLKQVKWNFYYIDQFLGGQFVFIDSISQFFGPNDSIIKTQRFTAPISGIYQIQMNLTNQLGCGGFDLRNVNVGYVARFGSFETELCLGDSQVLLDQVNYYDKNTFDYLNPTPYWKDTARNQQNKENIWWDIGDGTGNRIQGSDPTITYTKPGKYTVTLFTQDSSGCADTLVKPNYFTVHQVKANIGLLSNEYYCAPQLVFFIDSTLIIDSVGSTIPARGDTISARVWNFGDNKAESVLKNPAHNYTSNGNFWVVLDVTTGLGCKSTDSLEVDIIGPEPSFVILDSTGCEPFTAVFDNTSSAGVQSFTWYFGDNASTTLGTSLDTNITFTYPAGTYDVRLLGVQSIFNPNTGNTINCNQFFPDPVTLLPTRKVIVLATPDIDIAFSDSVCPNEPIVFRPLFDSIYTQFNWDFGDGSTGFTLLPDTTITHAFASRGTYKVKLEPSAGGYQCLQNDSVTVTILSPEANFDLVTDNAPAYTMNNSSIGAVRYEWDFGKPSAGAANSATTTNASFNYEGDTGVFKICLTAFDAAGCWDSICKETKPQVRLFIPNVFTPDNEDNKNDAFDIDILGYTRYELQIFNRWGAEVYYSLKDGFANDGINWNGKDHNEGVICPAGVYYFIFKYQLLTDTSEKTVDGTITLIR